MLKWVKPLGIALIAFGILLAAQYGWDLHRSTAAADQIRALHEQQIAGTEPIRPAAVQPESVPMVPEQAAGSRAPTGADLSDPFADPFAGLRQPLPAVRKSPLAELRAVHNDLVAWIRIDDTRIDYPVMKGRDNTYYLTHSFEGRKSAAGAIFMDYRNIGDGTDAHTIIYGHKMKSGTMFQNLLKFRDTRFYDSHRQISIDTLYGRRTYRVFAAYTTDPDFYYIQTRFDQASHAAWIAEIQKRSEHAWDTDVTRSDRILTLSTCSNDFRDARFVIHARLVD